MKKFIGLMLIVSAFSVFQLTHAEELNSQVNVNSQAHVGLPHDSIMLSGNVNASTSLGGKLRNLFEHRGSSTRSTSTASSTRNFDNRKAEADRMIENRIKQLNDLKTRIDAMARLSVSDKTTLDGQIQTSINDLTTLKAKIDADTDINVLKTDIASITANLRIYMLVMPKIEIVSAADRIHTIVDMMTTVGNKFDTRIGEITGNAQASSTLSTLLSDYRSKIADANVQANAAVSAVINLSPDNGNQTIKDANSAAMKNARNLLKTAREDLEAARKDGEQLLKDLRVFGNFSIHATSTASTSANH